LITDHKMIGNTRQVGVTQICQDHRFQPKLTRIFISGEKVFLDSTICAKIFINRPICAVLIGLTVAFLLWPLVRGGKSGTRLEG